MKNFFKKIYNRFQGQSLPELAVILLIVFALLSAIIAQAWSAAFLSHNYLSTFRLGMSNSLKYSMGVFNEDEQELTALFNPDGDGSRSCMTCPTMVIQDRLGIPEGDSKYGDRDRTPFLNFSAPSMTNKLFMPINDPSKDLPNVPRFHLYHNRDHFSFTTAKIEYVPFNKASKFWEPLGLLAPNIKYRTKLKLETCPPLAEPSGSDCGGVGGYVDPYAPSCEVWYQPDGGPNVRPPINGRPYSVFLSPDNKDEDLFKCYKKKRDEENCTGCWDLYNPVVKALDYQLNWKEWDMKEWPDAPYVGAYKFYGKTANYVDNPEWCSGTGSGNGVTTCPRICADERFDLDYNDGEPPLAKETGPEYKAFIGFRSYAATNIGCEHNSPEVLAGTIPGQSSDLRDVFTYQMIPYVAAVDSNGDNDDDSFSVKEETIPRYGYFTKNHLLADVNGDGIEDQVISLLAKPPFLTITIPDGPLAGQTVKVELEGWERTFGVLKGVWILNRAEGELPQESPNKELGLFFGVRKDATDPLNTQSSVAMYSETRGVCVDDAGNIIGNDPISSGGACDKSLVDKGSGTYLQIKDGASSITTNKQVDQTDVDERRFALNDVKRYCDNIGGFVDGLPNPVKSCGECDSPEFQYENCIEGKTLLLRSKLLNKRARKTIFSK